MTRPEVPFDVRDSWTNHLGNQSVDPLRIYRPESIDQVAAIVAEAERTGVSAPAVGSGHSRSDVALTTGFGPNGPSAAWCASGRGPASGS